MAGLRPYRASGFVVRRDQLGDKALVHNYGHGGAGITLSWGSSRLATNLGLQGHSGPVAVIGAGVMGLTTARLVQEAGFPVTIYTAALSARDHFQRCRRPDLAVRPFQRGRGNAGMAGAVRGGDGLQLAAASSSWPATATEFAGFRPTRKAGAPSRRRPRASCPTGACCRAADHPFPLENVVRYRTMYVETGRFLRQLTARRADAPAGKIQLRKFATPAELAALPETLIFNCTGIGARDLFGDTELQPVRGQLAVLQPQPEVLYAAAGRWGYMFPRPTASCSAARSSGTSGTRRPIPRRSTGSSRRITASSTASAAPLEVVCSAPNLAEDELSNLHSPERRGIRSAEGQAHSQGDRRRAERPYRRPGRREERRRGGPAQPLAPPAAFARAARRGHAQEHPDDRADRLRKDRDQPPPGQARRRPVREGRGDQVHRGRLCRPRRRADRPRPGRGSGPAGARAPPRGGRAPAPRKRRWSGCSTR